MADQGWSRADDVRLYQLVFVEKLDNEAAGKKLRRTAAAVAVRLNLLELNRPGALKHGIQKEGGSLRADGAPWTDKEIDTLRSLRAEGLTATQCAKILGRSQTAVRRFCTKHKIRAEPFWTKAKDQAIKQAGPKKQSADEVAAALSVSVAAVRRRAKHLKVSLHQSLGLAWTRQMNSKLSKLRKKGLPVKAISEEMGIPQWAVEKQIKQLGLARASHKTKAKRWTQAEEKKLRKLWRRGISTKELCLEFGRSSASINGKRERMGLKHSKLPQPWTPDHDQAIQNRGDKPISQLSNELGRSEVAIRTRLTRLRQVNNTGIDEHLDKLFLKQRGQCKLCPKRIPREWKPELARVDYLLPPSQGGADDIGNLQMVCVNCKNR